MKFSGLDPGRQFGRTLTFIPDINGDGIEDLALAELGPGETTGRIYIVYGRRSWTSAEFDLATLDGSNGFAIDGVSADDRPGRSLSTCDLNKDGYSDIISGAFFTDVGEKIDVGRVYVVFGFANGSA
ncbi:MAG: FG-GAP repeat protein [Myxococcales bacterium]|nr:MAG: FG-GAP repeat protein [Myxococcales bacterium]